MHCSTPQRPPGAAQVFRDGAIARTTLAPASCLRIQYRHTLQAQDAYLSVPLSLPVHVASSCPGLRTSCQRPAVRRRNSHLELRSPGLCPGSSSKRSAMVTPNMQ